MSPKADAPHLAFLTTLDHFLLEDDAIARVRAASLRDAVQEAIASLRITSDPAVPLNLAAILARAAPDAETEGRLAVALLKTSAALIARRKAGPPITVRRGLLEQTLTHMDNLGEYVAGFAVRLGFALGCHPDPQQFVAPRLAVMNQRRKLERGAVAMPRSWIEDYFAEDDGLADQVAAAKSAPESPDGVMRAPSRYQHSG